MTMTDPIADFLTRLRNANTAHHDSVVIPFSKLKSHIAEILQAEGYIAGWIVEDAQVGKNLVVTLKYGPNRERALAGVKRVSKPGLRVYAKSTNLPKVLGGLGVAILSTSSGPADRQAGRQEGRGWGSPRLRLVSRQDGRRTAMSRIGKVPVPVPAGVDVNIEGAVVTVKGPKGTLSHTVASPDPGRARREPVRSS